MNRHCHIDGCTAPLHTTTLCARHYARRYRHGDPHQRNTPADPITIETAVTTRRTLPGIRPAERRAAGQELTALGLPATEVARIFGVTPRTVWRWRAAARNSP